MPIPIIINNTAIVLPNCVFNKTSPYPTVVKVTKVDNHTVKIEGVDASATPVTITATCETTLTDTISVTCVSE